MLDKKWTISSPIKKMNNFVFYDSNLKFDIFNINLDRIIKKEGKSIIKLLKSELIRSRGSKAKKKKTYNTTFVGKNFLLEMKFFII
jgi:hypothetical protein